jgi:hypothetical protein
VPAGEGVSLWGPRQRAPMRGLRAGRLWTARAYRDSGPASVPTVTPSPISTGDSDQALTKSPEPGRDHRQDVPAQTRAHATGRQMRFSGASYGRSDEPGEERAAMSGTRGPVSAGRSRYRSEPTFEAPNGTTPAGGCDPNRLQTLDRFGSGSPIGGPRSRPPPCLDAPSSGSTAPSPGASAAADPADPGRSWRSSLRAARAPYPSLRAESSRTPGWVARKPSKRTPSSPSWLSTAVAPNPELRRTPAIGEGSQNSLQTSRLWPSTRCDLTRRMPQPTRTRPHLAQEVEKSVQHAGSSSRRPEWRAATRRTI